MTFSAPAVRGGAVHQQGHRRDQGAGGLHGRLPHDDRQGHLRDQRDRAGRGLPAGPLPRRLLLPEFDKTSDKDIYIAKIIPSRGAWLEFEVDKRDTVGVRIDRKRRQNVTVLLKALGWTEEEILELFEDAPSIRATLDKDHFKTQEEALEDIYRKLRPGRAAHGRVGPHPAGEPLLQPQALRHGQGGPIQGRKKLAATHRRLRASSPPVRRDQAKDNPDQQRVGAAPVEGLLRPDREEKDRFAPIVQGRHDLRGHRQVRLLPGQAARRRRGVRGRRHRPLRQPAHPLGGRADPEPGPPGPDPHGAGGPRAHDHPGRRGHHARRPSSTSVRSWPPSRSSSGPPSSRSSWTRPTRWPA